MNEQTPVSKTAKELEYEYLFIVRDMLKLAREHIQSMDKTGTKYIDEILHDVANRIEELEYWEIVQD